ncbi:MAG: chemotaxis protein CheB [Proteobacteria bacterium]|nr:chemotaxis protein CheB [Pseudomonadota bacterium]
MSKGSFWKADEIKRIVVIGASIGGIDALIRVVSGLETNLPIAVLVVQHLQKVDEPTQLPAILKRHTSMNVCLAAGGTMIRNGTIYVAEPGKHLCVKGQRLDNYDGEPVNHVKPSADVLFASVAEEFGCKTIGVVLTGTGKDGTQGCRHIKVAGGITIAQNRETSAFFNMPESAIKNNVIDFVLPLSTIPRKIRELAVDPDEDA